MIFVQQTGAPFLLVTLPCMLQMVTPADAPVLINEEPALAGIYRGFRRVPSASG
jgi:hypothetical protein